MPFLAETIWAALNEAAFERGLPDPQPAAENAATAPWPSYREHWKDAATEARIGRMQELIRAVREVRNRYNIEPRTPLIVRVRCRSEVADDFNSLSPFITALAGVGSLEAGVDVKKPAQSAGHVTPDFEAYVSLEGLIDPDAERKRLEKQIAEKRKSLAGTEGKLANAGFVAKAPPEVIAQQREQVVELRKQIASMEANLAELA